MTSEHSESTPQTLDTLIAELREATSYRSDHTQDERELMNMYARALDALEAMRAQRNQMQMIYVLACLDARARVKRLEEMKAKDDAEIARVLRGET